MVAGLRSKERWISKGEELTLLYGEFSDAQLLCNYGICPDMPGRIRELGRTSKALGI